MAREPQYTARISAVIDRATRDRLDAIERAHPVSLNDVIRDALSAGLPEVERQYAEDAAIQAARDA